MPKRKCEMSMEDELEVMMATEMSVKKKKKEKKTNKRKKQEKKEEKEEKEEVYTDEIIKELQSGSKTGSDWFIKNICGKRIVISDDRVFRWRSDIALWEEIKKKPARIIGDMLFAIDIDVGRFSVCTSLWNHSITGLTLPKETFIDLLDKQHRHLLPVANNNCLDLRTGATIPRTRDHMFTFSTSGAYIQAIDRDASLQAKLDSILFQIACERKHWVEYVQTAFGYSITGYTDAQVFLNSYGWGRPARTGKASLDEH